MDPMQQSELQATGGMGIGAAIFYLVFLVFFIAVGWKIFAKAGKPGWAVLVPIYNIVVYLISIDLAKSFGKGTGFAVGLIFLGFIFAPILAFGSAQYKGPAGKAAAAPA